MTPSSSSLIFFFNDPPTTKIYTLSLHDALPIYTGGNVLSPRVPHESGSRQPVAAIRAVAAGVDRKSTRLNSSHTVSSYAVFCLKKKTCSGTSLKDFLL